jgi:hypothetical protein
VPVLVLCTAACGVPVTPTTETQPPPTATPAPPSPSFDLEKLIVDVFEPQHGETVLVMVDVPHGSLNDYGEWSARREMAEEWRQVFEQLGTEMGFTVHPLLFFPATGAPNAPLPDAGTIDGREVRFESILAETNIVVALTEFSATAPLAEFTQRFANLRVASMPGATRAMEQSALAADYAEVARKAHILKEKLDLAVGATVQFSTGHEMYFDLRHRDAHADDGQLRGGGARIINLPSGEAYIAPYEGEVEGDPTMSQGSIPLMLGNELMVARVEENRIVEVIGEGPQADDAREYLALDEARRNIAELGLGCNDKAVVTGNVLEDEKVMGLHWANGLSEHIGGTVGPDDFGDPRFVVHSDWVYPKGGDIEITSLILEYGDGTSEEIIKDAEYTLF